MDTYDLFKKLSFGTKFNFRRFRNDAERFSLTKNLVKHDEMVETKLKNPTSHKKRKQEDEEEDEENNLVIFRGIKVFKDGKTIKKNEKSQIQSEEKKMEKKREQEEEKTNIFRNQHNISVIGHDVSNPVDSFQQLSTLYNVGMDLLENMTNCGYITPTPVQMQVMPIMLEGKEVLVCAPTGSGKTVAFLVPIIHHLREPRKRGFRAVILNPTRELMKQTYRECERMSEGRGLRIFTTTEKNQKLLQDGIKNLKKFDILITTPKRLMSLLNQEGSVISLKNVQWLIVDEADRLFEGGTRGFRDQLSVISKACTNPEIRRAMFSATNTPAVTRWCRENLKAWITVTIGNRNSVTNLIEQLLLFTGDENGKLIALRNIVQKGLLPPVLIFVQSKKRAQELFNEFIYDGINVDVIHSGRTQTQRDNVVRCFREGKIWVLVCTELMSRGIDFKGVNLVINFDFPPTVISYVHRIGRTGRAGHRGKAITFFTKEDAVNLRSIARVMRASGCDVPEYMLTVQKMNGEDLWKQEAERKSISTILKDRQHKKVKSKNGTNLLREET